MCETERGRGNERERQREQESKKGLYATVTTDILEFSSVRIFSILPRGLPGLEKLHDTQHKSTMRINAETGSTRLCSSPPLSKIVRKFSVQRRVCVCVCVYVKSLKLIPSNPGSCVSCSFIRRTRSGHRDQKYVLPRRHQQRALSSLPTNKPQNGVPNFYSAECAKE